jgi:hypothetical protein
MSLQSFHHQLVLVSNRKGIIKRYLNLFTFYASWCHGLLFSLSLCISLVKSITCLVLIVADCIELTRNFLHQCMIKESDHTKLNLEEMKTMVINRFLPHSLSCCLK